MRDVVLDWRPHWDPRSDAHRFTATPMCSTLSSRTHIMRTKTLFLDQGQEGACTGFGEENVRALSPYPMSTTNAQAQEVYHIAREEDEWPGEDYEGSSVNGAMRAARRLGLIKSWKWAKTIAEVRHGLSYHGAGEVGSYWWSGMWDPDEAGHVHPTGEKVGGHAYALAGYQQLFQGSVRFWIDNSWGPTWGVKGGAWIWEDELVALMGDDGEIAFPSKVH